MNSIVLMTMTFPNKDVRCELYAIWTIKICTALLIVEANATTDYKSILLPNDDNNNHNILTTILFLLDLVNSPEVWYACCCMSRTADRNTCRTLR